jgi:hypothetical protein
MVNVINAGSGRNGGTLTLVYLAVLDQSFGYGAAMHIPVNPHSPDEVAILTALDAIVGKNSTSCGGSTGPVMADPTGEADGGALRLDFDAVN